MTDETMRAAADAAAAMNRVLDCVGVAAGALRRAKRREDWEAVALVATDLERLPVTDPDALLASLSQIGRRGDG